jgi:catechol 2,3-dioxygenase-like lactoylglutathione lyase family enzyme
LNFDKRAPNLPFMAVQLNHTIIWCRDKTRSARFLTEILGLPEPTPFFHFLVVPLENGISLDFMETEKAQVSPQHYAFLISEAEFDGVFARVKARELTYWADPARQHRNEINRNDGSRGFYFEDPDGHFLEVLTRPYGSGPA